MAEMDIYMRRRLVALGGLVVFFIFFVLLVKSCGGSDQPQPIAPPTTGASGVSGATALTESDYIAQADEICAQANASVAGLDPADTTGEPKQEYGITNDELSQLNSLELADPSSSISKFLTDLEAVVSALKDKSDAVKSGDTTAADAAQTAIDTAEVAARAAGKHAGFSECGGFLDAGEAPTGGNATGGAGNTTITPTTPSTGGVTPTAPTTPTTPTTPPTTPPTGGGTGTGGGGITP